MNYKSIYPKAFDSRSKILVIAIIVFLVLLISVSLLKSDGASIFCEKETAFVIDSNGNTFGILIEEDKNYVFPNGAVGGYYIRAQNGQNQWVISETVDGFAHKEVRCKD